MIAIRMKEALGGLISESESIFVPNRLITDNVSDCGWGWSLPKEENYQYLWLCCFEIWYGQSLRHDGVGVLKTQSCLGFAQRCIDNLMLCVIIARYRFSVASSMTNVVEPTRGLCQVDIISPYLFIICAGGLSRLFQQAESSRRLHGCHVARLSPPISLLFFADDSLLLFF